ncbi:unnamed protein product, partial [Staurois parvus]
MEPPTDRALGQCPSFQMVSPPLLITVLMGACILEKSHQPGNILMLLTSLLNTICGGTHLLYFIFE